MTKLLPWVVIGALILALLWSLDSCRDLKGKATAWEAQYNEAVDARDRAIVASAARIGELERESAEKDSIIAAKDAEVDRHVEKITALTAELATVQAAEPSQPELESEPLVINLRSQVARLTEMFTLATGALEARDTEVADLKSQVKLWKDIAAEWQANYDREHALRLNCEKGLALYKRQANAGKFWRAVAVIEPVVFAGLAILGK